MKTQRTHGRTQGDYVADLSAWIRQEGSDDGLDPFHVVGKDVQSDSEVFNVLRELVWRNQAEPMHPCMLGGAMANILLSLLTTAWLSKNLSLRQRHMNCLIVYFFMKINKKYHEA